jgi:hypothetical protein
LAFSFPASHTARAVNYKVGPVWLNQFALNDDDYADRD